MKISRFFLTAMIACVGQILCAESFNIINTLDYPVDYKVKTSKGFAILETALNNEKRPPLLTISDPLQWIEWLDKDGVRHIASFPEYRSRNNDTIPLQKNKKNFFNIKENGQYMHNFGGYMLTEQAISLKPSVKM